MNISKYVCTYYTIRGQEDSYSNTNIETSLRDMMQNCLNFIYEDALLQTNDCSMGERRDHILVNHNPYCRPRIYGEDIEYYWGCTKSYY